MPSRLENWIDAARERLAELKTKPDAIKIGLAALLLVAAGGFALALSPRTVEGPAPILTHVSDGDVERTRAAAATKANLRAVDFDGNTALHIPAILGSRDLVDVLVQAGADVSAKNAAGLTPLAAAARSGSGPQLHEVAEALIAAGARTDEPLPDGQTLLHEAVSNAHASAQFLAAIARDNANSTTPNRAGETPLQLAERQKNRKAVRALQATRPQAARANTN